MPHPLFLLSLSSTLFSWNRERGIGERNCPVIGPASAPTTDNYLASLWVGWNLGHLESLCGQRTMEAGKETLDQTCENRRHELCVIILFTAYSERQRVGTVMGLNGSRGSICSPLLFPLSAWKVSHGLCANCSDLQHVFYMFPLFLSKMTDESNSWWFPSTWSITSNKIIKILPDLSFICGIIWHLLSI